MKETRTWVLWPVLAGLLLIPTRAIGEEEWKRTAEHFLKFLRGCDNLQTVHERFHKLYFRPHELDFLSGRLKERKYRAVLDTNREKVRKRFDEDLTLIEQELEFLSISLNALITKDRQKKQEKRKKELLNTKKPPPISMGSAQTNRTALEHVFKNAKKHRVKARAGTPTIVHAYKLKGRPGQDIVVTGANLGKKKGEVIFSAGTHSAPGKVIKWSKAAVMVTIPLHLNEFVKEGATKGQIVVKHASSRPTSPLPYTYYPSLDIKDPIISRLSHDSAGPGDSLRIDGDGFSQPMGSVMITLAQGTLPATIHFWRDDQVLISLPSAIVGLADMEAELTLCTASGKDCPPAVFKFMPEMIVLPLYPSWSAFHDGSENGWVHERRQVSTSPLVELENGFVVHHTNFHFAGTSNFDGQVKKGPEPGDTRVRFEVLWWHDAFSTVHYHCSCWVRGPKGLLPVTPGTPGPWGIRVE